MYFLLSYVENSSDKLKQFTNREDLNAFIVSFLKKHADNKDDNWIQFVIPNVTTVEVFHSDFLGQFVE